MAPLAPAVLGAVIGLVRMPKAQAWPPSSRPVRPSWRSVAAPTLTQAAVGAAQIGLAPLILQRFALSAADSAAVAGFCLAAANVGLLAVHRWITPRATAKTARFAVAAMVCATLIAPLVPGVVFLMFISCVIGGASALLLTLNLSSAFAARPTAGGPVAGWHGAAQIGGLALGVGLGSAVLPLSVAAPFIAAAALSAPLATTPVVRLWSAP